MRPAPLQHAPVRAHARPHPDTCPHPNGCARIAFHPHEDIVFAPGPTCLRLLTYVCARRVCAHSRGRAKSPRPVARVRALSYQSAPDACAPASVVSRRVRARSHAPVPRVRARSHQSAPGPTCPRPLARVRSQRGRAFTSRRTRPTARATSVRPQSFPASAPCSRVRPQQYINPFAPPHKSLYS
jgi:hypothetical protein